MERTGSSLSQEKAFERLFHVLVSASLLSSVLGIVEEENKLINAEYSLVLLHHTDTQWVVRNIVSAM